MGMINNIIRIHIITVTPARNPYVTYSVCMSHHDFNLEGPGTTTRPSHLITNSRFTDRSFLSPTPMCHGSSINTHSLLCHAHSVCPGNRYSTVSTVGWVLLVPIRILSHTLSNTNSIIHTSEVASRTGRLQLVSFTTSRLPEPTLLNLNLNQNTSQGTLSSPLVSVV